MLRALVLVVLLSALLAALPAQRADRPDRHVADRDEIHERLCAIGLPRAEPDTAARQFDIRTHGPRLDCASPDTYRVSGTERTLRLAWVDGLARVVGAAIRENRDEVSVGIVQRARRGPTSLLDLPYRATIELRRPLGDRHVVGATTGLAIDRRP